MRISAPQGEINAAYAYEDLHVPALFRQWAPRVADAAGITRGNSVLDVACGTGVLAREAKSRVGDTGAVWGLDADAGMLAVASELAPDIRWHVGLADALPFDDGAFDAVVSQFGLMFFPDRVAAIREMWRVLGPGGRLAVAVWESLTRSEAYPDEVRLLQHAAGNAAADALRAPFVLGDTQALAALFAEAGVSPTDVRTSIGRARFPSIRVMVEADLRGWLPVMGVILDEPTIERVLADAEAVMAPFRQADGSVAFESPAHIVTALKPGN